MNKKKVTIIVIVLVLVFVCVLGWGKGQNKEHEYFCDKLMLTVDDKQYDLAEVVPDMISVSELLPITNNHLFILGRIDENTNALIIYDFKKDAIVFSRRGTTMCWIQDDYDSVRYLMDNVVYDLDENIIYQPDTEHIVNMIEYVDKDFCVTIVDLERQNPEQVWVE